MPRGNPIILPPTQVSGPNRLNDGKHHVFERLGTTHFTCGRIITPTLNHVWRPRFHFILRLGLLTNQDVHLPNIYPHCNCNTFREPKMLDASKPWQIIGTLTYVALFSQYLL